MSPHFMGINRLFAHLGLIFSFHMDSNNKKLINEIEEQKKNDERKKGKVYLKKGFDYYKVSG